MELEELKLAWGDFERRVNQRLAERSFFERLEWRRSQLDRVRRGLSPLVWGQIAQMAMGIVLIVMGVSYWTAHREAPHQLACGVLIHAYGVLAAVLAGATLGRMRTIDYAAPVVEIQQRIERLRRWYVGCGAAVGLPWWLLWLPFMQIVFGYAGADFLGQASPMFLAANLAVGAVGLIATWGFHRWLHRPGRERLAGKFADQAAGASLNHARGLLTELARDENELPDRDDRST